MKQKREKHIIEENGEPEDIFNKTINPLLMPCILEMILSSLPVSDLRVSRGVCSTWNKEIKRFLKKAKTLKIQNNNFEDGETLLKEQAMSSKATVYLSQIECKESSTFNPSFEKLVLFMGKFLHKLILEKCSVDVNSFVNLILEDSFKNLSVLMLKQTIYVDTQGRKTIFILTEESIPILQNLRCLEIDERGPDSATTLKNIAIICPNLKRLSYGNCPTPNKNEYRGFHSPKLIQLEQLQLAPVDGKKMDYQYFEAMTSLRLKSLKSIVIYGMDPGGKKRMKTLQNFLKSVSSTLESLHLGQRIMYDPEYQPRVDTPFPVLLPVLKRMSVGPGFIHSLTFLDKVPKLSSFTCCRSKYEDWMKVITKGIPMQHNSLASLDFGNISNVSLASISSSFPNVVRLELNVSRIENHDDVVRAIFGGFPKLQMFNMYDLSNQNRLTDSGLTGLTTEDCDKISKSKKKKNCKPSRKFPYVGDLKCLIDLRLQYLSGQITDISVLYGVQNLTSLFAIDLSKSLITDESLNAIAERLNNLSILYVRDCNNITLQGVEKFRKLRPTVQLRC